MQADLQACSSFQYLRRAVPAYNEMQNQEFVSIGKKVKLNPCLQVFLNRVNVRCRANIACKLELMQPCSRYDPIIRPLDSSAVCFLSADIR